MLEVLGQRRFWEVLRKPGYAALCVIMVGVAIGCIFAGIWQIHRYDWKHGSNDTLRANNAKTIQPVGDVLSTSRPASKDLQFRRVTATGVFEPSHQLLVRNREVNNNPAFLVLTPLRTTGGTLLVVRGWVGVTHSYATPPAIPAPPRGPVTVTARVYPPEPANGRTAPAGQVDRLDVSAIAAKIGQPSYGGYAEMISSSPGSRLALLPAPDMGNPAGGAYELQHLAYVGQWFIFSLIALAAPLLLARIDYLRQNPDAHRRSRVPDGLYDPEPVANSSR